MSLQGTAAELGNALKTAAQTWDEVREGWDDPVSRDFEECTWEPLRGQTLGVLQAMDRLAPVLAKALRDCS